jgi:hypothetical protein
VQDVASEVDEETGEPLPDELEAEEEQFFAAGPGESSEPVEQPEPEPTASPAAAAAHMPATEYRPHAPAAASPVRVFQPAQPEAVKKAIDEVMVILSSLREAVDKMDEVLELLEEADRQKTADERDIESLRQQLKRFQRPVEEFSRSPRPVPQANPRQGQNQGGGQPQAQSSRPFRERDPRDRDRNRGQRDRDYRERDRDRDRRDPQGPGKTVEQRAQPLGDTGSTASAPSNVGAELPPPPEPSAGASERGATSSENGTDAGDPS